VLAYVLRRLLIMIPTLIAISLIVFIARRYNVPLLAQTDGWRNIAHAVFAMMS
jgi:ABC-type dipeptide/oligopeptide/nickel transport system permease component